METWNHVGVHSATFPLQGIGGIMAVSLEIAKIYSFISVFIMSVCPQALKDTTVSSRTVQHSFIVCTFIFFFFSLVIKH